MTRTNVNITEFIVMQFKRINDIIYILRWSVSVKILIMDRISPHRHLTIRIKCRRVYLKLGLYHWRV